MQFHSPVKAEEDADLYAIGRNDVERARAVLGISDWRERTKRKTECRDVVNAAIIA